MTHFITAVHMEPSDGDGHEHIASVQWLNSETQATDVSTREAMVDWINGGHDVWVADGQHAVQVGVVDATPPHLRTYADGFYTNNLLSLPRF